MAKKSLKVKQQREQKYKTREYNRCKLCGRPHAYIRKYGVCRECFRKLLIMAKFQESRKQVGRI